MTRCIALQCERESKTRLGYCLMHYKRWKRLGTVEIVAKVPAGAPCIGPGCPRPSVARGYCSRHIQRIYSGLPLEESGSLPERFMGFVAISDDGCWLWKGTILNGGYGQFNAFGKPFLAHRMSYELYVGMVPSSARVCHRCDVRACVRPDHLFLGTTSDNQLDRYIKGRNRINSTSENKVRSA